MTQTAVQRRFVRLAASMNAKAKRLGARGRVTAELLALIATSPHDPPCQWCSGAEELHCPYCGTGITLEGGSFDHVLPFDKGGSNTRVNIRFGCLTCNRAKYTKSPAEHEAYMRLSVTCPVDGTVFRPRYADWIRGLGRYCSRSCSAASRWEERD